METIGLEPTTSTLPVLRSPNWATPPNDKIYFTQIFKKGQENFAYFYRTFIMLIQKKALLCYNLFNLNK